MGKERNAIIRGKVLEGIQSTQVFQDRPNTFVHITAILDDETYDSIGFSKVCWPDTWDADYGIRRASKRAIGKLVRAVARGERIDVDRGSIDMGSVEV